MDRIMCACVGIIFGAGVMCLVFEHTGRNYQLIDNALYECTKPNKVVVTLREAKDGDCEFIAFGE